MKKVILMLAAVIFLASCSSSVAPEATPAADSTCVKTDTVCAATCESTVVTATAVSVDNATAAATTTVK
jgi:PBP1b-binding outer membrane lipoprotein LpoB